MDLLFPIKERKDLTEPTHKETELEFLERYGRPDIELRRQILNSWFSNYPKNSRKELFSRLEKSFSTAIYELFIHELFIQQGFELEVHPALPNSQKHPDFLAKKDGVEFYIEASEAKKSTPQQIGIEKKTQTLYDSINKTKSPFFFIKLTECKFKSNKQPKGKTIRLFLEERIKKYSIEDVRNSISQKQKQIKIEYDDNDISLTISLWPKSEEIYHQQNINPIGIYPAESYISPTESIKNAIEKKENRYGALDKPLILCINTGDGFVDDKTVQDILFGPLKATWTQNEKDISHKDMRLWEGVFGSPTQPKCVKSSGILITAVNLGTITDPFFRFTQHPFARNKLNFDVFDLGHNFIGNNNKLSFTNKKTIKELLYKK